jgi:hypothetical protein
MYAKFNRSEKGMLSGSYSDLAAIMNISAPTSFRDGFEIRLMG